MSPVLSMMIRVQIQDNDNNSLEVNSTIILRAGGCDDDAHRLQNHSSNDIIAIYPNPTANNIQIVLPFKKEYVNKQMNIEIYSLNGSLLKQKELQFASNFQLDLFSINNKNVILKIQIADEVFIKKINKVNE